MNALELAAKYGVTLTALAAALNKAADDSGLASKARETNRNSVTLQLKQYAVQTRKDGVSLEDARIALNTALTGFQVKEGTRKASGNHFAGFRQMLEDGVKDADFLKATNADAQNYIASEDVKLKKAAKQAWNKHTKDWSTKQWTDFLAAQGITTTGESEGDEGEVTSAEQQNLEIMLAEAHEAEPEQQQRTGTEG